MTVSYLDSKRINGLSTDTKPTSTDVQTNSIFTETDTGKLKWASNNWGNSGGWVELGRTTLGSANATISVSSLADKRYLMFLINDFRPTGATDGFLRIDGLSTSTYASRLSYNGGADSTVVSETGVAYNADTSLSDNFAVGYIANYATKEKLIQYNRCSTYTGSGATGAPNRTEVVGKQSGTTNPVSGVSIYSGGANTYSTGSEVVVLGYDPADTHATNFWTELGTGTASGSSTTLNVSFTAKKYLWVQAFLDGSGEDQILLGNTTIDTGANYASRYNANGGSDSTNANVNDLFGNGLSNASASFVNIFIINNTSSEKLCMIEMNNLGGTGAGSAPARYTYNSKWTNTSNQANIIQVKNGSNWTTQTQLKVWGSD